jgi:hypothetical protein
MEDETTQPPVPDTPEVPTAGDTERPRATRPRLSLRIVLVVAAAALLVAGVVAVRALGGDDVDPDAALRRARSAVADATSYRLTITTEDQSGLGALAGPGTYTTMRVVDNVEVSGDRWHSRSDGGEWVDESIVIDGMLYTRWGDSYTPIDAQQWAESPLPDPDDAGDAGDMSEMLRWFVSDVESITAEGPLAEDDEIVDGMLVSMVAAVYLTGLGDLGLAPGGGPVPFATDPRSLAVALGTLEDAEVVSRSDAGVTIRATRRAPAEVIEAFDRPVPDGRFEVVLDAHDRPVSLTLTVENASAKHTSRVGFSDWGATVTITAPAESEIDPTPWLDEEALAEARAGITPVRPTVLPEGIELQEIYPVAAAEAAEMGAVERCAQLNLAYGPPIDPAALEDPRAVAELGTWDDYVAVYLLPASCAQRADDTPFRRGDYGDAAVRTIEHGTLEVLVGDTVVQIDTSYEGETLAALVTSIQPFDLDAEIARLSALAQEMWSDPGSTPLGPSMPLGPFGPLALYGPPP